MTSQAADGEVLRVIEALGDLARHRLTMKRRDFDKMVAAGKEPHWALVVKAERAEYLLEQATEARAAVAALQAERDALRKHNEQLTGERFSERNHTALQSRAERAESALEALRGQVAGLVEALRELADAGEDAWGAERPCVRDARAELLAIKERMG